uniref:class III lanthionine synthetase LanKC N-terminal domain-containing protein n=1 Tax=Streptomyces sp. TG1A-60 TaxID=3129111 RepID=UPI00404005F0
MDRRYEAYALADRLFYETPDRLSAGEHAGTAAPGYETARRAVPEGWRAARIGGRLTLTPVDDGGRPRPSPTQGWKVHASATRANADRIAAIVWDYCVPRRIPFEFVPGPHLLHLRNAKYAARDTSGKFVTIYPADEGTRVRLAPAQRAGASPFLTARRDQTVVVHEQYPDHVRPPPPAIVSLRLSACPCWRPRPHPGAKNQPSGA